MNSRNENGPKRIEKIPSLAEIEITHEMIEAGADVIRFHDLEDYRATEIAALVFKTMISCKTRDSEGTQ